MSKKLLSPSAKLKQCLYLKPRILFFFPLFVADNQAICRELQKRRISAGGFWNWSQGEPITIEQDNDGNKETYSNKLRDEHGHPFPASVHRHFHDPLSFASSGCRSLWHHTAS